MRGRRIVDTDQSSLEIFMQAIGYSNKMESYCQIKIGRPSYRVNPKLNMERSMSVTQMMIQLIHLNDCDTTRTWSRYSYIRLGPYHYPASSGFFGRQIRPFAAFLLRTPAVPCRSTPRPLFFYLLLCRKLARRS